MVTWARKRHEWKMDEWLNVIECYEQVSWVDKRKLEQNGSIIYWNVCK